MLLVSVFRDNTCFIQPHDVICCRTREAGIKVYVVIVGIMIVVPERRMIMGNSHREGKCFWRNKWKTVVIGFAIILMSGLSLVIRLKSSTQKVVDSDSSETENANESVSRDMLTNPEMISVGFDDVVEKPMVRQRIAYKCPMFINTAETLKVDVAVGDYSYSYSFSQKNSYDPDYDTYGVNGYPILQVYMCDSNNCEQKCTDSKLLINHELSGYERVFSKEEMSQIDLSRDESISDGKHVDVEIDFSNYEVGSSGEIAFCFSWSFGKQPEGENPWLIRRQFLSFYVGEKGIACGGTKELAEINYYKTVADKQSDMSNSLMCVSKNNYLICENEQEKEYNHGVIIEKRYEFVSVEEVEACYIDFVENEGAEIVSERNLFPADEEGRCFFSILFRVYEGVDPGHLSFTVTPVFRDSSKNAPVLSRKFFFCNIGENDYVCLNVIDGIEEYSNVVSDMLYEITHEGELIETAALDGDTLNNDRTTYAVSGYIKWKDKQGNIHPAEGLTVQIYKGTPASPSFSLIYTSTTTSAGYYGAYFSYEGSVALIKIRVLSSGTNICVVNGSNATYTYESGVSGASSNITIGYTAENNSFLGRSISVHQGMALANKYMNTLNGSYMNSINVRFCDTDGITAYTAPPSLINIIYGDAFDWDVLEHEFGHYVQDVYDINNSPASPPDGHYPDTNLADVMHNKSNGIRLAWGEGWATYFAINLQNKMGASALGILYVGDTLYQDSEDVNISYDIENPASGYRKGEANEATVSAVLYDITDPINTSEEDQIYINNSTVWNITKNNHCTTLSEFINAFNASTSISKSNKVKLGSTLSRYCVSAKLNNMVVSGNTVTFTWYKQGGSSEYGNNSFRLVFYDDSFNLLYTTSYTNGTSQSISKSQWDSLFSNAPNAVYSCIQTRQTSSPTTGPYYSNVITTYFTK